MKKSTYLIVPIVIASAASLYAVGEEKASAFRPDTINTFEDLDPYWKYPCDAPLPVVPITKDGTIITADRQELREQIQKAGAFYLHGDGVPMVQLARLWEVMNRFSRKSEKEKQEVLGH